MSQPQIEKLQKDFELGYTYTRSTGPIVGHFLTGLREGVIRGIRCSDGRVIVPPAEFDPFTGEPLSEFVEVEERGEVLTWCWVSEPREKHPLQHPFAWALIRLGGSDLPMLHAVDAGSIETMKTGLQVAVRWAEERRGHILDISCFEPI